MSHAHTDIELDALREVANIGSSTAATAMSSLIGIAVEVSTPSAYAMPLADAIERVGPGEMIVTIVAVPVSGDLDALVLMILGPSTERAACKLIGVEADSDVGRSALAELGNILAASYIGALSTLTGLSLEAAPPERVRDMLRAVLSSALLSDAGDDQVIVLESTVSVAVQECSLTFLFVPTRGSVDEIREPVRVAT
ncbi:MAG TPA: chemotaxis protein CheC [Solirubrobacteraceae bacterium]|nr:chemotaxis protein CheC [Solirubrobacteraceae bacterium]